MMLRLVPKIFYNEMAEGLDLFVDGLDFFAFAARQLVASEARLTYIFQDVRGACPRNYPKTHSATPDRSRTRRSVTRRRRSMRVSPSANT